MQLIETTLTDVKLLQPRRYADSRGWFAEVFSQKTFAEHNLPPEFVQDNQSFSSRGVLRGLHYQVEKPQGKLVRVLSGHIWDVAVDLRPSSPDFGKWAGFHLRPPTEDHPLELLWIPVGFAHGFLVLSDTAEVLYKTTDVYHPAGERTIVWNDPTLNITWPLDALAGMSPNVSPKDAAGTLFQSADLPLERVNP
jgi:dTDP-4-dehydrorhamnose 3,5-epimerase